MRRAAIVAVQGEPGCNSALAACQFFGEVELVPCQTFSALFAAVRQGRAEYGMAPVENSLSGSVHPVWELLARDPLPVRGELYFHVRHCLIAHPGVAVQQIRTIYSHEQALAQCQRYIQRLGIDPEQVIPVYDTAGAVKIIKARGRREEAAIASSQAAALYDMEVLVEDIQTDPRNYTRFLVLSRDLWASEGNNHKTTLLVGLSHCGRTLPAILQALTRRGFSLLKVESCKKVGAPWEYLFYLEFQGRIADPANEVVLAEIRSQATFFHLVGSYPAAEPPP